MGSKVWKKLIFNKKLGDSFIRRHLQGRHKRNIKEESFPLILNNNDNINDNKEYDIRLTENFKLFISGPSR